MQLDKTEEQKSILKCSTNFGYPGAKHGKESWKNIKKESKSKSILFLLMHLTSHT